MHLAAYYMTSLGITSSCYVHGKNVYSTLEYETLRKGYSQRRNSCRKEREKQLQNCVHVKAVQRYVETNNQPQWLRKKCMHTKTCTFELHHQVTNLSLTRASLQERSGQYPRRPASLSFLPGDRGPSLYAQSGQRRIK